MQSGQFVEDKAKDHAWLYVVPATLTLLAIADWPYGYYQFLRIVVTGCAGWLMFIYISRALNFHAFTMGLIAVIYNPVFVIHMDRDTHTVFNVLTAVAVMFSFWKARRWSAVDE